MNLRILKKLSAQAAPLLPLLGDRRKQFRARCPRRDNGNYIGILIMDRKHWDRGRSVHGDCIGEHMIKRPAADGRGWVYMRPPSTACKGTIMVGEMSGGEEPEWDEKTAWEALQDVVFCAFTDWASVGRQMDAMSSDSDDDLPVPQLMRDLSTPSKIFQAARDIIRTAEQQRALVRHVPLGPWDVDWEDA